MGKIRIIILIAILVIGCKPAVKSDYLYGELPLSDFYFNKKCLTCNYDTFSIFFDEASNRVSINNYTDSTEFTGKFELIEKKNDKIFLKIYKSNLDYLNGIYEVKVDTLFTSTQRDEIAVSFKSEKVFFKGYKNIIKEIGNLK